jgi:hypothetical protein
MLEAVCISETSVYSSEIHGAMSQKAVMFRKILNCTVVISQFLRK